MRTGAARGRGHGGGLALVLLAAVLAGVAAPARGEPAPASPLPPPGAAAERAIAAGERHLWTVDLDAGQFLRAVVEQQGIDLVLHLSAGGAEVLTGDSPNGTAGPEPLSWIAAAGGPHLLAIEAAGAPGEAGRYRLAVEALRPAADADRLLVEAERAEYRGNVAELADTAEASRRAVAEFARAAELWRRLGETRKSATVVGWLASLHRRLGEPDPELARRREALALWQELGDPVQIARQANGLAIFHDRAGRDDEALTLFRQAREGFRAAGLALDEGIVACNIGSLLRNRGDGSQARRSFEEGLALLAASGDQGEQAGCLISLGQLDELEGDWEAALARFRRALALSEASGRDAYVAAGLTSLGRVYRLQGRFHEALELYHRVHDIDQRRGHRRGVAAALVNIGQLHAWLGRRGEAEADFRRALAIQREIGERLPAALTLAALGSNALRDDRLDEAARLLEEAAAAAVELANPPLEAEVAIALAELARRRGDPARAAEHAERALALARASSLLPLEGSALHQAGVAAAAAGDPAAAEERLAAALALWRRTGPRLAEADALYRLAVVARAEDRLDLARERIAASVALIESLRRTMSVDELRTSFLADRHRVFEEQVDLLMELHLRDPAAGWAERALGASEAGRARGLLDLLDRAGVDLAAGAPRELVDREAAARHRLNALERRRLQLAAGGDGGEALAAVEREIATVRREAAWLEAQVLAANPRAGELLAATPPAPSRVRALLAADQLLLELALGERRSFLWAVDAEGVRAFVLPPRAELEALARAAYAALSRPGADADGEAALAELSRRLLAPAAERLAGRRLIVVPDGALHLLPFAALPQPAAPAGAAAPPLVADHEIVQLPSAAVFVHLAAVPPPAAAPRHVLAVFADPVFSPGDGRLERLAALPEDDPALRGGGAGLDFQRLRFSREEAEALARLVPPGERLIALGLEASRETLLAAGLDDYRFVHFATHGVLDAEAPELSGLVLSLVDGDGAPADGFLRLHDVYRLDLAADLVTLSACRTALGREVRGEGLVGLTRGFLHAGARGVLASLWDVQDRATAELMERFYGAMLGGGLAPAAALRSAQLALWREGRWSDPYSWAGFVLQAAPAPAAVPSPDPIRPRAPAPPAARGFFPSTQGGV